LRKNRDKRKVLVVVAKKDEIKKSDGILTLTEKEEKTISLSLSRSLEYLKFVRTQSLDFINGKKINKLKFF